MDTAAAAAQAGVTVATIRTWCRRNVIAATKVAGRWVVDAASLAYRIAIGRRKAVTRYTVTPVQVESLGRTYTRYAVVRTDGTTDEDPRIRHADFPRREHAEVACEYYNRTPDGYRIERGSYPARSIYAGRQYWRAYGGRADDPQPLDHKWDDDQEVPSSHPEGTRPVDILIKLTLTHAAGAEDRIARHAEKQAAEREERARREAREQRLADLRRANGPLATLQQVEYILALLERRRRTGEEGGFFYGPTDREGIEELSRQQASAYITSLKGDY